MTRDQLLAVAIRTLDTNGPIGRLFKLPGFDAELLAQARTADRALLVTVEPLSDADARIVEQLFKRQSLFMPLQTLRDRPIPPDLVRDLIPQGGFVLCYGREKLGKSFLMVDLCVRIASGTSTWHGKRITRWGPVAYAAGEGAGRLPVRFDAAAEALGNTRADLPIYLMPGPTNLRDGKSVGALIDSLRDIYPEPLLLVLDTLSQHSAGADENSQADASLIVGALNRIRQTFPSLTVIVVHHTPFKDETKARGSNVITGAADAALCVQLKRGVLQFQLVRARDIEEGSLLPFELRNVTTNRRDTDGERIRTSIVVSMASNRADDQREAFDRLKDAVLNLLSDQPQRQRNDLQSALRQQGGKFSNDQLGLALRQLVDEGRAAYVKGRGYIRVRQPEEVAA